jgi:hypothetical protein
LTDTLLLQEAWEVDISDEEWDQGASTDEETVVVEQNLPPPTYEEFEAALRGGSNSSGKSKAKAKQGGSISFNLRDIPKKPSLVGKPTARPGMQEAAQPPPPPPPPTLGTRPRPRDGFVEPTVVSKPPPPRVVKNVEPVPKKEPPPPPPLMAAPTKPQLVPPPAALVTVPAPAPVAKIEEPAAAPTITEPVAVAPAPVPPASKPQLSSKPPLPSPAPAAQSPLKPPSPQYETTASGTDRGALRRARSVQLALDLQASKGQVTVKVWQTNAAGVLVSNDKAEITGFIPLTELSHVHASAILKEERRIRASIVDNNSNNKDTNTSDATATGATTTAAPAPSEGPAIRRAAMGILRDQEFLVEVIAVDKESGRVIFSEKAAAQTMSTERLVVSPEGLAAAAQSIGSLVECRVRSVRPFGLFVDFPLKLESGQEELGIGLVHSSELSWDNALPASVSGKSRKQGVSFSSSGEGQLADFAPGQVVTARLTHVDPRKARIFLSIRRATPNPLLETLDSLLASTSSGGAGATMPGASASGPRQTLDAAVDIRPLVGDLEVAQQFAEAVVEVEGVISATLGVRLESRASSPDVEVYMAKETGEEGASSDSQGAKMYRLVIRCGVDVQEVEIKCVLDRIAVRELAAATVAKMGNGQSKG